MRLLADESVDRPIVERLRRAGREVDYVAELDPGIIDDVVIERARAQASLLVTADKDFGELVFRLQRVSSGVVLIRLAGLSPDLKADIVSTAIREHGDEMVGAFSVVSPGLVRIRRRLP
jgi:predicted nuclease of predicted toxin-antitoxin system